MSDTRSKDKAYEKKKGDRKNKNMWKYTDKQGHIQLPLARVQTCKFLCFDGVDSQIGCNLCELLIKAEDNLTQFGKFRVEFCNPRLCASDCVGGGRVGRGIVRIGIFCGVRACVRACQESGSGVIFEQVKKLTLKFKLCASLESNSSSLFWTHLLMASSIPFV